MKKSFILILLSLICFGIHAQDTISLKRGQVINAFIIEKSDTKIKYRTDTAHNSDSTYTLKLTRINTIRYSNGEVDLLSSQNPRNKFPLGVSVGVNIIYGLVYTASIDYLIAAKISAEIKYAAFPTSHYLFPTISFGGKYWFANKYSNNAFSPYVGLFLTRFVQENDEFRWNHEPLYKIYYAPELPVGVSYISKSGLQSSFQLNLPLISAELKIGWRFNFDR